MKGRFRELARRHHPDKHAGDDKRQRLFGRICEAYRALTQPIALCGVCGREPATVHETTIRENRITEQHWCKRCMPDRISGRRF